MAKKALAKGLKILTGGTFIGKSRSVASEQKAIWHNVTGAGASGVIRRFFDVNERRQQMASEALDKLVAQRLKP